MLALAETVVLLALTVLVVRRSRAAVAVVGGTLTGLAVPLWLVRFGLPTWSTQSVGGYAAWGMLSVLAVVVGLYLRALDERRTRAVAAARHTQWLELADDLHDCLLPVPESHRPLRPRLAKGEGRPGAFTPARLFGPEVALAAGAEFVVTN